MMTDYPMYARHVQAYLYVISSIKMIVMMKLSTLIFELTKRNGLANSLKGIKKIFYLNKIILILLLLLKETS